MQGATGRTGQGRGAWAHGRSVWLWTVVLACCARADLEFPPDDDAGATDTQIGWVDAPGRVVIDPFAGSCAHKAVRPEKLPLDLFIMVDSSGSMTEPTASGVSKWDAVRGAFGSFFRAPGSSLAVALQFFPLVHPNVVAQCTLDTECGDHGPCLRLRACTGTNRYVPCDSDGDCDGGTCQLVGACGSTTGTLCIPAGAQCNNGTICQALPGRCELREICSVDDYAAPAVDFVALPGGATTLSRALALKQPDGMTPMGPALAGALETAHAQAAAQLDRRTAVVLATDGFPTTCSPITIADMADLATAGRNLSPPVPTFVIGVFSPEEAGAAAANLNAIARAGGSEKAFIVNTGRDVGQDFLTALNDIRAAALACEYLLPADMAGAIDFFAVNVRFTQSSGAVSAIGNVADFAACHPEKGGWYYDIDPTSGSNPTRISTCPATCERLRADPKGLVDLVFGCQTVVIE